MATDPVTVPRPRNVPESLSNTRFKLTMLKHNFLVYIAHTIDHKCI